MRILEPYGSKSGLHNNDKRCPGAFMVLVQQLVKGMGGAVPVQDLPRPRRKRCQGAFKILVQQVVKRMRGAVPVQDLPGPIVEHCLHPLDFRA